MAADNEGLLSEEERKIVGELLGSPLDFPNRFKQWFVDYMAQNIPPLPIDHIQGYVKTRGYGHQDQPGSISINNTWTDLGGPDFFDLPGGDYLMMWGMYCPNNVSSGVIYRMGPVVDGGGSPSDSQACKVSVGSVGSSGARARVITVGANTADGQGSLEFQYKASLWSGGPGANASVNGSWVTLIRV